MCDSYNDLDCPITMSTIGTPDATFVGQKVGDDLQFKGLTLGAGVIGVISPTSILIDTATPVNPIPTDGVIGNFDQILYSAISPLLWPTEIPFTLLSSTYNTGLFAGNTLTITTPGYHLINFNPGYNPPALMDEQPTITFRIRDGLSNIYAEFYSRVIGSNDEDNTSFYHQVYLPVGTYQFTIQVLGYSAVRYQQFRTIISSFSVYRVG